MKQRALFILASVPLLHALGVAVSPTPLHGNTFLVSLLCAVLTAGFAIQGWRTLQPRTKLALIALLVVGCTADFLWAFPHVVVQMKELARAKLRA